tara:strand:+ start:605 stop:787 length:183 start_codon:yes stop_codon:yes gene_type:complete
VGLVKDQAAVEGLGVAARRALQYAVVGEEVVVEKREVRRRADEATGGRGEGVETGAAQGG